LDIGKDLEMRGLEALCGRYREREVGEVLGGL
jgi:hypothetical protein